jgi:hypothetical protein
MEQQEQQEQRVQQVQQDLQAQHLLAQALSP